MKSNCRATALAYLGIVGVLVFWAAMPLIKQSLIGGQVSAAVYNAITTLSAALLLLGLSWRQLPELNRRYLQVALPTGLALALASLAQSLAYTVGASPTNQAFLENLSSIAVPILLLLLIKERPTLTTVASGLLCLLSSLVLAGVFREGMHLQAADGLNALAGILYGVNIALTGIYAKQLRASLLVMLQLMIKGLFSLLAMLALPLISVVAEPIDPLIFDGGLGLFLLLSGIGLLTNAVCWTVRTAAMRHVSPTVVAIIMPCSAVITGLFAVMLGRDALTPSLLIGGAIGLAASLLSGIGDALQSKKRAERGRADTPPASP